MIKALFVILINVSLVAAGSNFSLKYGVNTSKFYNDVNSSFLRGYSFGVDYEYSFPKNFYIGIGLYFTKIGGMLNEKIIYLYHKEEGISVLWREDIHAQAGYLKIPLNFGYNYYINKNMLIKIHLGYSLMGVSTDYTYGQNHHSIDDNVDPNSDIEYDYRMYSGVDYESVPPGDHASYSLDFGAGFVYKKVILELATYIQPEEFGVFDDISKIKKNLFTVELLFGLYF